MSPWIARCPAAIRTALAALIFLLPLPAAGQVLRGRVVDAQSGAGVPLARVAVTGVDQPYTGAVFSDADGRFTFPLLRDGSFRVRVTRAGYAESGTDPVSVAAGATVDVTVRLAAVAHRLDAVTVAGRARRVRVSGVFDQISDIPYTLVNATGQRRSVEVRGWFPVPHVCHHLSGSADLVDGDDGAGPVLVMLVQARATGDTCGPGTGSLTYDARVRRLPPGTYAVRIFHAFEGDAAGPAMVLDTIATVR